MLFQTFQKSVIRDCDCGLDNTTKGFEAGITLDYKKFGEFSLFRCERCKKLWVFDKDLLLWKVLFRLIRLKLDIQTVIASESSSEAISRLV